MENEFKGFEIGDSVFWHGMIGEIIEIKDGYYPIKVMFRSKYVAFTVDGRFYEEMTEPSIRVIARKKKKVMRDYWFVSWKGSNNTGTRVSSCLYLSKDIAESVTKGIGDLQLHSIQIECDE